MYDNNILQQNKEKIKLQQQDIISFTCIHTYEEWNFKFVLIQYTSAQTGINYSYNHTQRSARCGMHVFCVMENRTWKYEPNI